MKLAPRQLASHLKKHLAPIYLLSGDEPLQMMEAADLLRKVAAEKGYSERQIIHAEAGFDWSILRAEAAAMSLFSERKVLDLRLRSGKPGRDGSKALVQYAARPPEDNVLLIQSAKLDRGAANSAWVKALDKVGVVIQIWDLSPPETMNFVTQRLQAAGFIPDREAARLLTERVEGNLLAAVQEVEKLCLLRQPGPLNAMDVLTAVTDSARYDPFELVDAALMGDSQRTLKILWELQAEGVHASQILWALSRDLRLLADYADLRDAGHNPEPAFHSVWNKRKPMLQRAVRRHSADIWRQLLRAAVDLDHVIKGVAQGNVADELLQLLLWMAGEPVFTIK